MIDGTGRRPYASPMGTPARLRVAVSLAGLALAAALAFAGPVEAAPLEPAGVNPDICSSRNCATVNISLAGNGSGTVTSTPAGINCVLTAGVRSGTCSYVFSWSLFQETFDITLEYQAQTGSGLDFGSVADWSDSWTSAVRLWSGDADSFSAWFRRLQYPLTVSKSGAGTGKVTSAPAGIDCGATCSRSFDYGTSVTLTAAPGAGSVFRAWTGACAGQGATCSLQVTQATSANAVFELPSQAGGGSTGEPTTGGGATGGTGSESDTSVEAELVGVATGKSRLGKRVVRVEVAPDETISVTLELVQGGKTIKTKRVRTVRAGDQVVTLVVPGSARRGKARLTILLEDRAGNEKTLARSVRLPRA